jgi:hypothetical protein
MSSRRPGPESSPANWLTPALRDRYSTLLRPAARRIGGRMRQILEALKVESDQSRRLKDLYEDWTYDQREEQLEILLRVLPATNASISRPLSRCGLKSQL